VRLTAKNLLVNSLYYGLTVVALPYAFHTAERFLGIPLITSDILRFGALNLGISAVALQVWSIVLLQRIGKGTPSPFFPTHTLVVDGPYRFVRNPLNLGELMVLGALAAWFGSLALLVYFFLAFLAFHLFVLFYEESANRRRFDESYGKYEATVNRWMPRVPRTS